MPGACYGLGAHPHKQWPLGRVRAKHDGLLNLEESEELLRDVVRASDPLEQFDILVDTRDATSTLSATDLWFLADRLVRHPRNKGIDMQAFTSDEEAMRWLQAPRQAPD